MAIAGDIPLSDAHWVLVDILTLILYHAQNQSTHKDPFLYPVFKYLQS